MSLLAIEEKGNNEDDDVERDEEGDKAKEGDDEKEEGDKIDEDDVQDKAVVDDGEAMEEEFVSHCEECEERILVAISYERTLCLASMCASTL